MTARLVDDAGHEWPITGTSCPTCRMPTDPTLDGDPHPECRPARVLGVPECAEVLRLVVAELGARPLPDAGRWRTSGVPIQTRMPVPSPRTSITDNRQEIPE